MQDSPKDIILDYAVPIAKRRRTLHRLTPVLCVPGAVFLLSLVCTQVIDAEKWMFRLTLLAGFLSIFLSPWALWRINKRTTGSGILDWFCAVTALLSGAIALCCAIAILAFWLVLWVAS